MTRKFKFFKKKKTDITTEPSTEKVAVTSGEPQDAANTTAGKTPRSSSVGSDPLVEPDNALPETSIESLPRTMKNAVRRAGWTELMSVQAKTIPYVMARRDLLVQSRTGSGKTGAFILPMLERIDPNKKSCQALVLVPTRELAAQVAKEAELLAGQDGVRTVAVYGGVGYSDQVEAFNKGAHLVVGTPGRVLDHLLKRNLILDTIDILVFDEADRLMSMGFYPDMKEVQSYLPNRRVNAYMFSATFPPHVIRLADQFLHNPETLSLSRDHVHVTDCEHIYYVVEPMKKDRCLVRIIEIENPTSAIIFCNTKAKVHYVTVVLQRFGHDADELSADLSQGAREKIMARARNGKLRFLVATDVAARGIDIPDLSHVILYEPPEDPEAYIHRAGRTGRAGASGEAVSLVAGIEQLELERIAERYSIVMQERPAPTDEDVANTVSQRVTAMLESQLRHRDSLQVERMQRFIPLVKTLSAHDDESALIAMLIDDYYQSATHAAPPTPPAKQTGPTKKTGRSRSSRGRRPRKRQ